MTRHRPGAPTDVWWEVISRLGNDPGVEQRFTHQPVTGKPLGPARCQSMLHTARTVAWRDFGWEVRGRTEARGTVLWLKVTRSSVEHPTRAPWLVERDRIAAELEQRRQQARAARPVTWTREWGPTGKARRDRRGP